MFKFFGDLFVQNPQHHTVITQSNNTQQNQHQAAQHQQLNNYQGMIQSQHYQNQMSQQQYSQIGQSQGIIAGQALHQLSQIYGTGYIKSFIDPHPFRHNNKRLVYEIDQHYNALIFEINE